MFKKRGDIPPSESQRDFLGLRKRLARISIIWLLLSTPLAIVVLYILRRLNIDPSAYLASGSAMLIGGGTTVVVCTVVLARIRSESFVSVFVRSLDEYVRRIELLMETIAGRTEKRQQDTMSSSLIGTTSVFRFMFFGKARVYFERAHDDFEFDYFTVVPGSLFRRVALYISFFIRFLWMFVGAWVTYSNSEPYATLFRIIGGNENQNKDD